MLGGWGRARAKTRSFAGQQRRIQRRVRQSQQTIAPLPGSPTTNRTVAKVTSSANEGILEENTSTDDPS